jgi:uncharacterized HAD superfamily protein
MMKIIIDVDNVIADFETCFREYLNKKTKKKLGREDINEFEFHKSFGISGEEEKKFHNEFFKKNGYRKLKRVKGSQEGIIRLMEIGQIGFISARTEEKRDITLDWFRKNSIPISPNMLFLSKDKLIYASQFDVILEDKWEDSIRLAQNKKIVILFDYPWNRKKDEYGNILVHENIVRISNWKEAVESIEKIAEEKYKRELKGEVIEIWKESVGVQMHFNQLIMRNRITVSSVIFAAFGAALVFLRSGDTILRFKGTSLYISDVIILIAAIGLFSYALIDILYYFRLLLGAVAFTEKMDREYRNLGLTSSITKSIKHKRAKVVLIIHYVAIAIGVAVYALARIWLRP